MSSQYVPEPFGADVMYSLCRCGLHPWPDGPDKLCCGTYTIADAIADAITDAIADGLANAVANSFADAIADAGGVGVQLGSKL